MPAGIPGRGVLGDLLYGEGGSILDTMAADKTPVAGEGSPEEEAVGSGKKM